MVSPYGVAFPRFCRALLVTAFAIVLFQTAPIAGGQDSVNALVQEARGLFDAFQYEEAISAVTRFIESVPPSQQGMEEIVASAYELRARAWFALGDSTKTEADFAALLRVRPEHVVGAGVSPRVTRRDSRSSVKSATVSVVGSGARVARRTSACTRASSSANANGLVK